MSKLLCILVFFSFCLTCNRHGPLVCTAPADTEEIVLLLVHSCMHSFNIPPLSIDGSSNHQHTRSKSDSASSLYLHPTTIHFDEPKEASRFLPDTLLKNYGPLVDKLADCPNPGITLSKSIKERFFRNNIIISDDSIESIAKIYLSHIILSSDATRGALYMVHKRGGLDGGGSLILLEKAANQQWEILQTIELVVF